MRSPLSRRGRLLRPLVRAVAMLVLVWPMQAQAVLDADLDAVRQAGYVELVDGLLEYAKYCKRTKMFLERQRALELLLLADPDHAPTRRELGYRKRGDLWVAATDRRTPRDRGDVPKAELTATYSEHVRPFVERMVALSESKSLSAIQRNDLEEEVLQFDPDNALLRERRAEVRADRQWLLAETMVARERREELEDWFEEIRESTPKPKPLESGPVQENLKLRFEGVATPAVRVFATSGVAEADKACIALTQALAFFNQLFGKELTYPEGCTVYLLRDNADRDMFLERHPNVSEEARRRLVKYQGAGIEGSTDWVHWADDPVYRRDAIVRIAIGYLMEQAFETTLEQPWIFEGFGSYFTVTMLGTHCTWFATPVDTRDPVLRQRLFDPESDWMREAQVLLRERATGLTGLVSREISGFATADLLASHAFATYLIEAWPEAVGPVLLEVGRGKSSVQALERRIDYDLDTLSVRLRRWIDEREGIPITLVASHTADQARAAWRDLDESRKRAVIAAFREKLASLEHDPSERVQSLLTAVDSESLPAATIPTVFDAKVHAPTAPVKRRWLERDDRRAREQAKLLKRIPDSRAIRPAWEYEWSTGRIVRVAEPEDEMERLFANALQGYPPDIDLARAVLMKEIDGGHERKSFAAFAHAYTDRDGYVYPDVTLYDTWSSGTLMEMPDIDALGIIHDVLNDWDTWKEPIPGSEQSRIYARIGELFTQAKRYRELREAIVDCYLVGRPVCADGYESTLTNYHALWAFHDEDVAKLAADLPDGPGWRDFIEAWVGVCKEQADVYVPGIKRQTKRVDEGKLVRTAFIVSMEEQGAFR